MDPKTSTGIAVYCSHRLVHYYQACTITIRSTASHQERKQAGLTDQLIVEYALHL